MILVGDLHTNPPPLSFNFATMPQVISSKPHCCLSKTRLHYDLFPFRRPFVDGLVRQNWNRFEMELISQNDILSQHRKPFNPHPFSNDAIKADYRVTDPRGRLHSHISEQSGVLNADSTFNFAIGTNDHIRTNQTAISDFGTGVLLLGNFLLEAIS